ncbi:Aste57867_14527 [Aphanomyces stellatus]|uniref:Aste57867_14527 protein n=1 Tax=Aphanomyces stellatus TaxID=120398 RepID=A0A485L1Y8_9STRA|nr:hypothetical protein As57867_014473 [Aphanomyces stellatus]VFT91349.1 Aste57867_14527 [Aphanomyces stellatus]
MAVTTENIKATIASPTTAPTWIFVVLCFLHFLNSFDRGIIPGAPAQFQYFLQTSKNTTDTGTLFGLLSSSFVASYSVAIPLFGYLSMSMRRFQLIAIGLAIWSTAVFMCSAAKEANSFNLLFYGRVLSGAGEASFQCIAPPFIDEFAPDNTKTLWLGVYYISAMVGGTSGSIVASGGPSINFGWDSVYACEGLIMMPVMALCLYGIPPAYNAIPADDDDDLASRPTESKSFLGEVWAVCSNAVFVWIAIASAAAAFSSSGVTTFATLLLMGLGVFKSETDANVVMGAQSIMTAMVGTLLGGILLDCACKGAPHMRQYLALRQLIYSLPLCILAMMLSLYVLPDRMWYLAWSAVSHLISASLSPVLMTALFHSVEPSRRALTTGVYTLVLHVLGDVPAPIIMGAIKDSWAPHCNSVKVDGVVKLNPECGQDKDGLIQAMVFPMLWMVWALASFGAAMYLSKKQHNK